MREIVILAILLLNLTVQSALFPFIEIVNVKPDSLLVLVVSFALLAGNPTGILVGFLGGLLQDILFGSNIGLHALQYMIVGYLVGILHGKLYVDKFFVPLVVVMVANMIKEAIMLTYNFFVRSGIPPGRAFSQIIVPETIYTMFLTPLIFYGITWLYHNKFMKKKYRFRKEL
ncbi:MAG: rod shape-determining protein MreD [Clostridiales bacterium]|jgi:rod shape-determining protein MreD|nr:rod shape-determining protein MreD [Clostridiales bacterium]